MGRPFLFLDVEGVLKTEHTLDTEDFDPDTVEQLRRIIAEADPEIVLASTWRKYPKYAIRVWRVLGKRGLATPDLDKSRGAEIAAFLNEHPGRRYVIVDDDYDFLPEQVPNVVQTSYRTGLNREAADEIINKLKAI